MASQQVTVVAYLTVRPGTEEVFLDNFAGVVAQTRAEPGCISYTFHQHATDSHRFVFVENFVDQAAFDSHVKQPHTVNWVTQAEALGARFDVEFWHVLGN